MTPAEILAAIEVVCSRGGDVFVAAGDRLNPACGYSARITLATPWKSGPESHLAGGDTAAAALAAALAMVQPAPAARRPSAHIEGRWYITDRAAREYAHLMRPRTLDVDKATDELIALSLQAHFVRDQENELELWRVKAPNGARIRLLVGKPDGVRGGKLALVRILGEHGGAR